MACSIKMVVTMHNDLGMADLGVAALKVAAAPIRVVALDRLCFRLSRIGNDGEPGDRSAVAISPWLSKLAGGNALLPDAWLQMVIVAL